MLIRQKSAGERTRNYLLAAMMVGLGGGSAVAAAPKKASSTRTKAVAVQGASKKPSKSARKGTSSRKSRTSAASSKKSVKGRELASAAPSKPTAAFRTDSAGASAASLPEKIIGAGINGKSLPYGQEDKFRQNPDPKYVPTDLVRVPSEHSLVGDKPAYLRQEAALSFQKMVQDAAAEGLDIKIVSAYRDVAHQTRLYNNAIKRYGKGQKMVGRPGRSEHFLGTTVDVTNGKGGQLLQPSFANSPEYRWMEKNIERYGWKFTVRAGVNGRKKSQDEPWHIRYMGGFETDAVPGAEGAVEEVRVADAGGSIREKVGSWVRRQFLNPEKQPSRELFQVAMAAQDSADSSRN